MCLLLFARRGGGISLLSRAALLCLCLFMTPRAAAAGTPVCSGGVHRGWAHQGVHRYMNVITASGYASGMHRACIGVRRYASSDHPFCRSGCGGFGRMPNYSELELESLLSSTPLVKSPGSISQTQCLLRS